MVKVEHRFPSHRKTRWPVGGSAVGPREVDPRPVTLVEARSGAVSGAGAAGSVVADAVALHDDAPPSPSARTR